MIELDARRLMCPMPVIKTQNIIKTLSSGDKVRVSCTDPGVMQDIPAWCRINGHTVLSTEEIDHEYILIIKVGSD
ncbi:MAG: sulfurtransferase TusA family protein [Cycloclasticus pugetii]|jgi:tRNA 2-thiouridine synthesizing protein A|uniref:SirA-like protein n=2 Tax=Cycloclasticus TaxID=34067 RepID=S5TTH6_9GAMM|nr:MULTISPECIES: sulfurtransferase TusA family protein [Cycloclasticus]AFT66065.1 SirA-like protein [Cycloclasticus sp. P1]AGS38368.1 SirA-like protein [Cycloclasticus zancles 78-ME]ATI02158.1 sulfurtransferase TusA family protein [Cycloclasticus sp. PY97N]EPD13089.1 SirA-like protein [Cycloclasticus pugetii]MBV1897848.1 sulfurtransferase TusA family protein [Cycloclasticus sp.]|tara:strand:+ start:203 stop:427 length:225 start_codon:yes stop_codon:yes gene_type:complete